jgi:hypothetical protein
VIPKPLKKQCEIMVEAAGVEPASEKARDEKPTCVAGSKWFGGRVRIGKIDGCLARLISALGSGPKPAAYPARMTLTHQPTGELAGAAT